MELTKNELCVVLKQCTHMMSDYSRRGELSERESWEERVLLTAINKMEKAYFNWVVEIENIKG